MMQTDMVVTVYSHHFAVTRITPRGRGICMGFSKPLVAWKMQHRAGYSERVPERVYAASDASRSYFRFHINQLEKFKAYLTEQLLPNNAVEWILAPPPKAAKAQLKVRPQWTPKEDQVPHIDYLVNAPHPSKLLTRQTGSGKTVTSLFGCERLGFRLCIVVKPMYIDKWIGDVLEILEISPQDLMVIKGSKHLKSLLMLAQSDELKSKVIIVSLTTLSNWIDEYEERGDLLLDEGYGCRPWEFFETIGAGIKLVDEVHQHFHQLFKLDLYTHILHSISLSATLLSQDTFIERMYEIMFPRATRPVDNTLRKYIDSFAVHYDFINPDKIRTVEWGSKNYSHAAVEKSILKHVPTKLNYFRLIDETLKISYFKHPRAKKKAAVYAASVEMCTQLTAYFKKKYPQLDIRRYCASEGDPFKDVIEPDIRFSTIGSSGTAIDIPDLTTVILTIGLSSIQANIQVLGRLRYLSDAPVEFYFLTASNINKHVQYYEEKRQILHDRAKSFRDIFSGLHV